MNSLRSLLQLVALLLLCCLPALAQTASSGTKRLNKDGVSFSYPARWSFWDSSNQEAQKFLLESGNSQANIMLVVHQDRVLAENWNQAVETVALSYVASFLKQYEDFGAKPKLSHVNLNIGSARAQGMIIRGTLYKEPRTDQIYWAQVNERLVVLMFGTPDKDRRKAAPAWHTVRNSIQFAGQIPPTKPRRNRRRK